jgi:hypothetical protein
MTYHRIYNEIDLTDVLLVEQKIITVRKHNGSLSDFSMVGVSHY